MLSFGYICGLQLRRALRITHRLLELALIREMAHDDRSHTQRLTGAPLAGRPAANFRLVQVALEPSNKPGRSS